MVVVEAQDAHELTTTPRPPELAGAAAPATGLVAPTRHTLCFGLPASGTPERSTAEGHRHHGNRGDQAPVPGALREQRAHASCRARRCRSTTRTCCSSTPAWCSSCRTSWASRPPPYPRAASVQKCIRTPDIDEVGKTSRHGTFFQMNGNFSFGDYFKEGAIPLAWELVTKPGRRGRLRPGPGADLGRRSTSTTTRRSSIWRRVTGVPAERIVRRGQDGQLLVDGHPRPGGPCSEIYYDRGPEYGPEGGPEVDEDRYLEFWNLVFMQYEIAATGSSKEDFRDPRRAAGEEHRHRHGPGADGLAAAGRRQPLRDRRGPPDPGPGGRADRQALRRALRPRGQRVAPRRRPAAGDRRPRAHRADADRRRGDPVQRGPRLRAAPDHAPGDPVDAAARLARTRRCPSCCRWPGTAWRRRTRSWRADFDRISPVRVRARRRRSWPRCAPGTTILDTAIARDQEGRRHDAVRATRRSSCTTRTASRST